MCSQGFGFIIGIVAFYYQSTIGGSEEPTTCGSRAPCTCLGAAQQYQFPYLVLSVQRTHPAGGDHGAAGARRGDRIDHAQLVNTLRRELRDLRDVRGDVCADGCLDDDRVRLHRSCEGRHEAQLEGFLNRKSGADPGADGDTETVQRH